MGTLFRPTILALGLLLIVSCSAVQEQSRSGETHYILGLSYLQENNPTMALREFLQAAESDPNNAEIQGALAMAYHRKQAFAKAEAHYLKAIELSGKDPQYENNLAALYLDQKRWDDAIAYFRRASTNLLFTKPEVALTGIGFSHFQKADYLNSVLSYQDAISSNAQYPQAHFGLGEAYYALDKTDLAITAYKKALGLVPGYVQAHYKLGLAHMKTRNKEGAEAAFKEVIRLAPESESARLSRDYLKLLH